MEEKPKIFVQTNPNNNYPDDISFFEILVHETAHYCHFATISDLRTKHIDPTKDIFCLHGVDGFFIEGVAQYLTEVVFQEFDVTIEERVAKASWELRSAVMYYNLYGLGRGLTSLDQASDLHSRFLGQRKNLAKSYEYLMKDRLMATQMFNYFASLMIIKNHAFSKNFASKFYESLSTTSPEQFKGLFTNLN
ncbi:hypothetical protein [Pseudobacteriovorax antillogorgiicola]|uniref:Uncharacterized protein n=1 Tax=Pseudobacteriovorax antillogorgiicola TaxID=1513793 RepID=A0A1Y6CY11_9BACT|nr:hypothetical protein [Pseudobacteriovorax antillogorgiicola]TCS40843.1 hypothetical protein EDD56_1536 [Pseudobacteriovorax antillogorgiicola]SMF84305.1 hypothetical protein SAMN06296036_1537 [Pseudobacteriovorax antillogorgiicola]